MKHEFLQERKAELSNPKTPVTIHELAKASETLAKPNVPLCYMFGFLAGGVLFFFPAGIASMYAAHAVIRP